MLNWHWLRYTFWPWQGNLRRWDFVAETFSLTICTAWNQLVADPAEWRDEAGDAHQAGVSEKLGHFRNTPDVFFTILGGEAQVLIESVANVVSVQGVTRDGVGHEVLFQGKADGRLPGARQA